MSKISTSVMSRRNRTETARAGEDWFIIPSGNLLFIVAIRGRDHESVTAKQGWCQVAIALRLIAHSPDEATPRRVVMYIPADVETRKIEGLLQQVIQCGKNKSFSVASAVVPLTVGECLLAFGEEANKSNMFSEAEFRRISLQ